MLLADWVGLATEQALAILLSVLTHLRDCKHTATAQLLYELFWNAYAISTLCWGYLPSPVPLLSLLIALLRFSFGVAKPLLDLKFSNHSTQALLFCLLLLKVKSIAVIPLIGSPKMW